MNGTDTIIEVSRRIRLHHEAAYYDHRGDLPDPLPAMWQQAIRSEEYRRRYACFKYAVALAVKPRSVCEIGVGPCIAALAFLRARPGLRYVGIDNGYDSKFGYDVIAEARRRLAGFDAGIVVVPDSQDLKELPSGPFDLVHIDGGHDWGHAFTDTCLAWDSGTPWIMVDDGRDPTVASAALTAIRTRCPEGLVDWAYFEDTWTGSILIQRR